MPRLRLPVLIASLLAVGVIHVGVVQAQTASATAEASAEAVAVDTISPVVKVSARFSKCVWKALRVRVSASDASGIASVDFSIDGRKIAADITHPYEGLLSMSRLEHGSHELVVRTRDIAGNLTITSKRFKRCTHPARTVLRIQPRFTG